MVVIWSRKVPLRGTVKVVQDTDNNILKSCIECGRFKEITEFNKNTKVNSQYLFEVLEDECLDCIVNKREFPQLPEECKIQEILNNGYHEFKKLFIRDTKRNDYEIWEFKVTQKRYILFIKDKETDFIFNQPFKTMQGIDSARHAAYHYFIEKYGASFFSDAKTIRICSYSVYRKRPLVRRNYSIVEFLEFIPEMNSVDLELVKRDLEGMNIENTPENYQSKLEGKIIQFYGNKYERSPINRKKALEIHGFSCEVCDFNFEKVYGERGKEFIEVHHIDPLYSLKGEEQYVNPSTDLIPVCSNCHRMIHRKYDKVLSIEEMRNIVNNCKV